MAGSEVVGEQLLNFADLVGLKNAEVGHQGLEGFDLHFNF
jgi:hypothetical protein